MNDFRRARESVRNYLADGLRSALAVIIECGEAEHKPTYIRACRKPVAADAGQLVELGGDHRSSMGARSLVARSYQATPFLLTVSRGFSRGSKHTHGSSAGKGAVVGTSTGRSMMVVSIAGHHQLCALTAELVKEACFLHCRVRLRVS